MEGEVSIEVYLVLFKRNVPTVHSSIRPILLSQLDILEEGIVKDYSRYTIPGPGRAPDGVPRRNFYGY